MDNWYSSTVSPLGKDSFLFLRNILLHIFRGGWAMASMEEGLDRGKRRRAAKACEFCRKRKMKCDDEKPRCTNCKYVRTRLSTNFGAQYVYISRIYTDGGPHSGSMVKSASMLRSCTRLGRYLWFRYFLICNIWKLFYQGLLEGSWWIRALKLIVLGCYNNVCERVKKRRT